MWDLDRTNVIVVGYGSSGRRLHQPAINKAIQHLGQSNFSPIIHAVDPLLNNTPQSPGMILHDSIPPVPVEIKTICHICTPTRGRYDVIGEVLAKGHKYLLIEKPAADNPTVIDSIAQMARQYDAEILVVSVFSNSTAVAVLRNDARFRMIVPHSFHFRQDKSRYSRSRQNADEHIFDIETPHQVALALDLFGPGELLHSSVTDMIIPNGTAIKNMGTGVVLIRHLSGVVSFLSSSLISPQRERRATIGNRSGAEITINFPASADDNVSTLSLGGNPIIFDDSPLDNCVISAYRRFLSIMHDENNDTDFLPESMSLQFQRGVVNILSSAKYYADQ